MLQTTWGVGHQDNVIRKQQDGNEGPQELWSVAEVTASLELRLKLINEQPK